MNDFKRILVCFVISVSILIFIIFSCQPVYNYIYKDAETTSEGEYCNQDTHAAFWGLPAITFKNWRPNIHIKASTDNGTLAGRVWDGTPDINPDSWSIFEYSQITYYDSDYTVYYNFSKDEEATVDQNSMFPLAFEQKLYKRTLNPEEPMKYDVTWDSVNKAVVITLNTSNSNYLQLQSGNRIAIISTQRPKQWGSVHDYTIIDSIPANNSMQKSSDYSTIKDNSDDRSVTREVSYITYTGGVQDISDDTWTNHWFKELKLEPDKITIFMPYMSDGDTAKTYWDSIDSEVIAPFMLFWIAIEQDK